MAIGKDEVRHVAKLAALEVPEADLPVLVEQLQRIVAMVDQLSEIPSADSAPAFHAGPNQVTLREDALSSAPDSRLATHDSLSFTGTFFTVPRHTAMEGE